MHAASKVLPPGMHIAQRWRAKFLRILPIALIIPYLLILFALFVLWPVNWQIFRAEHWFWLTTYVLATYTMIAVGFWFGSAPGRTVTVPRQKLRDFVIVAGAGAAFILLFPTSIVYTGRWPWEVLGVLGDQGEAYRTLQEQLELTTGERGYIALARAFVAPLTFAVLPLGLIHWNSLSWFKRSAVGLAVATVILLSLLRGTDREFVELIIIGSGAMMVSLGRSSGVGVQIFAQFARRYWLLLVAGLILFTVAATLFSDRKSDRLGNIENRTAACVNTSKICADLDAPGIRWMPQQARFATSLFILSSSSGFYGLAIAMEKEWRPTYGVGHSPATLAVYELITGDDEMERRTFTYRNGFEGWSELNYWSTLMTWIANDVGFGGALIVILAIAYMFGVTWRDATLGRSDAAAVLFCAILISMFYLSANNQLLGSYDGYFVIAGWTILWFREKRKRLTIA